MSDVSALMKNVRKQIEKTYGVGSAVDPSDANLAEMLGSNIPYWLDLGNPQLNEVFGKTGKGLPASRILEIFGEEGHGKSSLVYYIIGQVQKQGGLAFLIDTEGSYDIEWAEKLGVDNSLLTVFPLIPTESCIEVYFDMISSIAKQVRGKDPHVPLVFVHDTIYATPTQEGLASNSFTDKQRLLSLPRALSEHLKILNGIICHEKAALIFVNQVRDNVGVAYGAKFNTPGGRALKHACSVRVIVKRMKKLPSGIHTKAVNYKNKVGAPFLTVEFKLTATRGLSFITDDKKKKK